MARALMATTRPYISLSSSRTNLLQFFRSQKKSFVSGAASKNSLYFINREAVPIRVNGVSIISRSFKFGVVDSRRFSTRATNVNDAGSIEQPLMQSMETKIKEQLNAESVSVKDMSGDGRHVCIDVISSAFEGQSSVNRQRMVYKAIWEELQNAVHAVDQMTTRTPTEAEARK